MVGHYDTPKFKVAAVQAGPIVRDAPQWFDLEATLDKAIGLIDEAGRKGARLIVFPECWMPCYPCWSFDFANQPTFRDMWAKFLWSSVEVPSRETEALCTAAKRANAYVVMGINERDKRFRGRMYNSILYLSPSGKVMGTHRKICITIYERFFHTQGDGGDNLKTVFKTEIGNLGGSICGEHSQPTLLYNWMMQGIQIHCSLWPGLPGLETASDVKTRALCSTADIFAVLASAYIPEKDRPENFFRNSQFSVPSVLRGGSGVINPYGEYISGPVYDQETIVYGDIDLSETDRALANRSLTGIYNRWDLININVRQEPYEPMVPMEGVEGPLRSSELSRVNILETRIKQLEQQIAALSRKTLKDADTSP
jgi:aliphatic nitrilase